MHFSSHFTNEQENVEVKVMQVVRLSFLPLLFWTTLILSYTINPEIH